MSEQDKSVIPAWMTSTIESDEEIWGCRAGYGFNGHGLAEAVWGKHASLPNSGLIAFGYLWRRFGPPAYGSDDHKELVSYVLGTPRDGVYLELGLKAMELTYSVGFLAHVSIRDANRPKNIADLIAWEKSLGASIEESVKAAMLELLRPVYVRDVPINLFGRMSDQAAGKYMHAKPSKYAGYGIPLDAIKLGAIE